MIRFPSRLASETLQISVGACQFNQDQIQRNLNTMRAPSMVSNLALNPVYERKYTESISSLNKRNFIWHTEFPIFVCYPKNWLIFHTWTFWRKSLQAIFLSRSDRKVWMDSSNCDYVWLPTKTRKTHLEALGPRNGIVHAEFYLLGFQRTPQPQNIIPIAWYLNTLSPMKFTCWDASEMLCVFEMINLPSRRHTFVGFGPSDLEP